MTKKEKGCIAIKKDLSLLTKTYDMIKYSYPILGNYPKSEKFSLVQEIKRCELNALRLMISANLKYYKKTTQQDLDIELTALRYMVRLSRDMKFINMTTYEEWSRRLDELGKMLGGWIRSTKQ